MVTGRTSCSRTNPPNLTHPNGTRSIAYRSGSDYDSVPSLEQLEAAYVYLADVDPSATEPYAGHWIGISAGNSPEELPVKYQD